MQVENIQKAIDRLPRLALNDLPTPLHYCPRITEELGGPPIYFKRDDLTHHAFGGNKSRYLEFTMGQAVEQGADAVLLSAVVQSNHCRQFSAAAARHGLKAVVVLNTDPSPMGDHDPPSGNYMLDHLYGADVRVAPRGRVPQVIDEEMERLRGLGYTPVRISGERSSISYVQCALELARQADERGIRIGQIYISSCSTSLTGLVAGFALLGLDHVHFCGFPQSPMDDADAGAKRVAEGARRTAELLGLSCDPDPARIRIDIDHVGPGFGRMDEQIRGAIRLLAQREAILVDPTYTGKAFSGLVDHVRQGEVSIDEDVIFVHTGGTPLVFVYGEELI